MLLPDNRQYVAATMSGPQLRAVGLDALLNNMQYPPQVNEAVGLLLSRVPDFAEARSQDSSFMSHGENDSPYLVFGDFALFFAQQLEAKGVSIHNESWLQPSFQVIDEMLTSADPELVNLIQVGVLEVLAGHPGALTLVKTNLSAPGQKQFEEWVKISNQT